MRDHVGERDFSSRKKTKKRNFTVSFAIRVNVRHTSDVPYRGHHAAAEAGKLVQFERRGKRGAGHTSNVQQTTGVLGIFRVQSRANKTHRRHVQPVRIYRRETRL